MPILAEILCPRIDLQDMELAITRTQVLGWIILAVPSWDIEMYGGTCKYQYLYGGFYYVESSCACTRGTSGVTVP